MASHSAQHSCCGPHKTSPSLPEKPHRICYVAGHSGGHIIPCLTLARQAKEEHGHTILFITSTKTLDKKIIRESGIVDEHYTLPIVQQRSWYRLPLLGGALIWSFCKSFFIFLRHRPARIISTGSIVAIPSCLAGWILRIPIELFEVNAMPGKTIQFLARFATKIYVCFSRPKHFFTNIPCEIQPYPIRFTAADASIPSHLSHFSNDRYTLFVQGGSQGSRGINAIMRDLIVNQPTLAAQLQIIHQTGEEVASWRHFYEEHTIPSYVFAYEQNVAPYYQRADIIIARAGAGSLFEALHFHKPCITFPLTTTTTSHQLDNAYAMAAAYPELFHVLPESKTSGTDLAQTIATILHLTQQPQRNTETVHI